MHTQVTIIQSRDCATTLMGYNSALLSVVAANEKSNRPAKERAQGMPIRRACRNFMKACVLFTKVLLGGCGESAGEQRIVSHGGTVTTMGIPDMGMILPYEGGRGSARRLVMKMKPGRETRGKSLSYNQLA